MLEWNKLLCEKRQRSSETEKQAKESDLVTRNAFEADYDRIVGSSSVRRLQDKAQVFPLQENDFTRTRLTHSMEVSAMARSLGKSVGKQLEKRDSSFTPEMTEKLEALLQTAGLIHDLGNPPFGHYGETVIREWFKLWFESNELLAQKALLSEQEKNDFLYFDGNVQNIRIITKLQTLNDEFGANFTYATIASVMKYPYKSSTMPKGKAKFGYFKSEEHIIDKVFENVGIREGMRHPAAYLLEAADDIIYVCDDIEDGVKKGYIEWEECYEKIKKEFSDEYSALFKKIDEKAPCEYMGAQDKKLARVRNFRNLVQTYLFKNAVQEFLDNYDRIMSGEYNEELLVRDEKLIKYLKKNITGANCFCSHEVLALELVGDKVIKTLLDIFVNAIVTNEEAILTDPSKYPGKVFSLISSNFVFIAKQDYENNRRRGLDELSIYDKLHLVVDYISGMTDSYAVNLYKELTGISIPE